MIDGYRRAARRGAAASAADACGVLRTLALTVVLFVADPQRLLPDPGHRPDHRPCRSRAGRLAAGDEAPAGDRQPCAGARSRRRGVRLVLRQRQRQHAEYRAVLHGAEAARRAHRRRASQVISRLRPQLAKIEGRQRLFLQPAQDITVGGRISRGQFQYTLQDADLDELNTWAPRMLAKLKTLARACRRRRPISRATRRSFRHYQSRRGGAFRHPAAGDR